jgi:hypothetical protein
MTLAGLALGEKTHQGRCLAQLSYSEVKGYLERPNGDARNS